VGARNAKQAIENAATADIHLSDDEIETISGELEKLELVS
jgi:aryl-alcohol dehydrogenase-like predicted oxidoreductase